MVNSVKGNNIKRRLPKKSIAMAIQMDSIRVDLNRFSPIQKWEKFFLTLLLENCFRYPLAVGIKLTSYPFRIFTALKNKQVLPTKVYTHTHTPFVFFFFLLHLFDNELNFLHTHTHENPLGLPSGFIPPLPSKCFSLLNSPGSQNYIRFFYYFSSGKFFFFFITC